MTDDAYRTRVDAVLRARDDVWGEEELDQPGGPTIASLRARLRPSVLGDPDYLVESGFHYVVFADPDDNSSYALHVADGGQIISEYTPLWGAPEWALPFDRPTRGGADVVQHDVLIGEERFGSALTRLDEPQLADAGLPVLRNVYRDQAGTVWERESFARREDGMLRSRLLLRVRTWGEGVTAAHVLIRSRDFAGAAVADHSVEVSAAAPAVAMVLDNRLSPQPARSATLADHDRARADVIRRWDDVLASGARIAVPDAEVTAAARNLIVQNLILRERYSVGNPYETVFMMEAHLAVLALLRHGHAAVARDALDRLATQTNGPAPEWYESWERGAKLEAGALYFRLTGDPSLLERHAALYIAYFDDFIAQMASDPRGLLHPERYAWDIPEPVYGLHSQACAWRGMRDMVSALEDAGLLEDAERYRSHADLLLERLRTAIDECGSWLDDGTYFVPVCLYGDEPVHGSLTESRRANYWNLVAPFAFATGILPPSDPRAEGVIQYMRRHGAWLMGLTRYNGLYDPPTEIGTHRADGTGGYKSPGIDNAFGVRTVHFLADNEAADRLVLTLYAKLAHGMTPGTFVDGEATTVGVVPGEPYRSSWYPPNGTSNAGFLDNLRLALVREELDASGRPIFLHILPATPRAWLEPGNRISVQDLPTQVGALGVEAESREGSVEVVVELAERTQGAQGARIRLHLRLPSGTRATSFAVDGGLGTPLPDGATWIDLPLARRAHVRVTTWST
ncbi:MAG: hypothetical protein EAS51_06595 [Microbacteriaceae bacterium]|nr:MAG: hypothetical protein EAS51_06595 [Microbacteriaceae bacterium]